MEKLTRNNLRKRSVKKKMLTLSLAAALVIPPVTTYAAVVTLRNYETGYGRFNVSYATWPDASWGRVTLHSDYYNWWVRHYSWAQVSSNKNNRKYSGTYPNEFVTHATSYGDIKYLRYGQLYYGYWASLGDN